MQVAENETLYDEHQTEYAKTEQDRLAKEAALAEKQAKAEKERLAKDAALAEKWERFGAGVTAKDCGELIGSRNMYLWGEMKSCGRMG